MELYHRLKYCIYMSANYFTVPYEPPERDPGPEKALSGDVLPGNLTAPKPVSFTAHGFFPATPGCHPLRRPPGTQKNGQEFAQK